MGKLVRFPKARAKGDQPVQWQGLYTITQVSRLARIPLSTLYEWKAHGIIKPSIRVMDGARLIEEGYSYADMTIIKILRALREDEVDLASAGAALHHLFERLGPPSKGWADAHVYFVGKRIYAFKEDEWETTAATQLGQKVETRLFGDLFRELRDQEEPGSILIPADYREYIEINPEIMGGQPVIKGTRVPTYILAILKGRGKSVQQIAKLYKPIPTKAIKKAIQYEQYLDSKVA